MTTKKIIRLHDNATTEDIVDIIYHNVEIRINEEYKQKIKKAEEFIKNKVEK